MFTVSVQIEIIRRKHLRSYFNISDIVGFIESSHDRSAVKVGRLIKIIRTIGHFLAEFYCAGLRTAGSQAVSAGDLIENLSHDKTKHFVIFICLIIAMTSIDVFIYTLYR